MHIDIRMLDRDKKETGFGFTSHPLPKFVAELVYDEIVNLLSDEE